MPEQTERRLGAVLMNALSMACEQKDIDVARLVYQALQLVMTRRTGADEVEKRAEMADTLQAVYDRYAALERALTAGGQRSTL
ncbi:MAG: hypothetical protein IRY94_11625 [Rhodospirillaceae bacterium]|nr:hypothetical protein [Rhodospirillaceae bacterium]